ncbi:hypothetical protein SK128_010500 [Halocaridina rubra]|uniref:Uncharacterized protein n=1 Tax=Halocaridina rubra TaxID=373956 RepID=A0AAN8WM95_HALRR
MKTYWLASRDGRKSIKGQVNLPSNAPSDEVPPDGRKASVVSRNYSPITFEDVARRSLSNTPTPSAQPSLEPPAPAVKIASALKTAPAAPTATEPPKLMDKSRANQALSSGMA